MDIDCMPLNPLENMPASLRRHNVGVNKFFENFNELKMDGQLKDRKLEGYMKFASSENIENADGPSHVSPSTYPMSNLLKQAKDGSTSASQSKVGPCETANGQKVSNSQPSILAQIQANEADVQALSALTHALDKKTMPSLREGGNSFARIEEAIDYVNNRLSVDESGMPAVRCTPADSVHGGLASQDQVTSCTSNPLVASHAPDPKLNASDQNEAQIPSELISHCVPTLLMIQKCTERQFPPADVAQILESAVMSLQPCCSQNRPIYAEIQKCMGIIKSQILALIPT